MATLIIHTDIECNIYIDTELHGFAEANTDYVINVGVGAYWILCKCIDDESISTDFDVRIVADNTTCAKTINLSEIRCQKLLSQYDSVQEFSNGYAKAIKDKRIYYVNTRGEYCFDTISPFEESRAIVSREGILGIIDENGVLITGLIYDTINCFHNGHSIVSQNGKYGVIDLSGHAIIPTIYNWLVELAQGFIIQQGDLYGILGANGQEILSPKYEKITVDGYSSDRVLVYYNGKLVSVIPNSQSAVHDVIIYDYIEDWDYKYKTHKDGKIGLISRQGETIIPTKYDDISYWDGVYNVAIGEQSALIINYEQEIIPLDCNKKEFIKHVYDGIYIIRINDETFLYNGQKVVMQISDYEFIVEEYVQYGVNKVYSHLINICSKDNVWGLYEINSETLHTIVTLTKPINDGVLLNERFLVTQTDVIDILNCKQYHINIIDEESKESIPNDIQRIFPDGCSYIIRDNIYIAYNDRVAYPVKFSHIEGNILIIGGKWEYGDWDKELREYEYKHYTGGIRGWVKSNGTISPIIYDSIHIDNNCVFVRKDGYYGLLSCLGEVLFSCEFEGIDLVNHKIQKNGKIAKIDATFKKITPLKYDSISGNIVRFNGKYGLIDNLGNEVTQIIYDDIVEVGETQYIVALKGLYGCCDNLGNIIVPIAYSSIKQLRYNSELLVVSQYGQYGLCDRQGQMIILINFDSIEPYNQWGDVRYVTVVKEGLIGLYDIYGNRIINTLYDEIKIKYENYAIIKQDGKYGCYGIKSRKMVIPIEYDEILIKGVVATVQQNGKYGCYSIKQERIIISVEYDKIDFENRDEDSLIEVKKGNLYGVFDFSGKEIVPVISSTKLLDTSYHPYSYDKHILVESDGYYGVYNRIGTEIIPPIYDKNDIEIISSDNMIISCDWNKKQYTLYSIDGSIIAKLIYERSGMGRQEITVTYSSGISYTSNLYIENIYYVTSRHIDIDSNLKERILLINIGGHTSKFDGEEYTSGGIWFIMKHGRIVYVCDNIARINIFNKYHPVMLACINGRWGGINENLEIVIPCIYDSISYFKNGIAIVELDDKYGLIDINGRIILDCKYDYIDNFVNGMARVMKDSKDGLISEDGRIIHECVYDSIINEVSERRWYSDERYTTKTTKFKFPKAILNDEGKTVYLGLDGGVYDFVVENGDCAFIKGKNGKWAIYYEDNMSPFIYDAICKNSQCYKSDMRIHCVINQKRGVVDGNGNVLLPFIYDKIFFASKFSDASYIVTKGSSQYYLDKNGMYMGDYHKASYRDDDDDWDGNIMSDEDMYRDAFCGMPDAEWNID